MKVGSLFSGAGLGDLGLTWAGFAHEWFCEYDAYARRILRKRFPGVFIYENVLNIVDKPPDVDVIIGGFPCQAFSSAARGRNISEKDIKNEFTRIIRLTKPPWCIGENVQQRPVQDVAKELRDYGYKTAVFRLGSYQTGAWHKRNRWWVVAHPDMQSEFYRAVYAKMALMQKLRDNFRLWEDYTRAVRVSNGRSDRVDRLKCLGNGQDPFITYAIGLAIKEGY